jgi:hypothetical protein
LDKVAAQVGVDALHDAADADVVAVHLVDEKEARAVISVGRGPDRLRAHFDARNGLDQHDALSSHLHGAVHLADEVEEAGGVQQVELDALPLDGGQAVAMELLRWTSSSSKSIAAVPLCTSPIRVVTPVLNNSRSTRVVLPAPLWEIKAMLRI